MGKFSELDLHWWEKEALEELEYEFHISERTTEELNALTTNLYWKAQNLIDEANILENKSDIIRRYLDLIEK
jgi:hypothetical protein